MDTAIIKDGNNYIAVSLFPVCFIGWGKTENGAINSLNDNLYDFCNWLSAPLPKDLKVSVVERVSGEIGKIKLKADENINPKKYAEITIQTAFSFKCFWDSFEQSESENELCEKTFAKLGIDGGVLGYSAEITDSGDKAKMREFIFYVYSLAKTVWKSLVERKVEFSDTFRFNFAY